MHNIPSSQGPNSPNKKPPIGKNVLAQSNGGKPIDHEAIDLGLDDGNAKPEGAKPIGKQPTLPPGLP